MARLGTPLGSHAVLRTTDIDRAIASVASSLAPHRLTPVGRPDNFRVVHNAASVGELEFHFIDYGAAVDVTAGPLDFHLVQIPLGGTSTFASGNEVLTATSRTAVVTACGQTLRMRHAAGNPRLMVRISSSLLRERMALSAEGGLLPPRRPGMCFDVSQGVGRSWRNLVDVMLADLEHGDGLGSFAAPSSALAIAVVDGLIASLAGPPAQATTAPARLVRRAARLIEDHCAEPLGTPDIAEALGVSIRTLQAGFREHLGCTPMAYLRQARLDQVRQSLADGSATSVTEAAMRWGVTHLGRLAGDYRAAFGETPSATLERAR